MNHYADDRPMHPQVRALWNETDHDAAVAFLDEMDDASLAVFENEMAAKDECIAAFSALIRAAMQNLDTKAAAAVVYSITKEHVRDRAERAEADERDMRRAQRGQW